MARHDGYVLMQLRGILPGEGLWAYEARLIESPITGRHGRERGTCAWRRVRQRARVGERATARTSSKKVRCGVSLR